MPDELRETTAEEVLGQTTSPDVAAPEAVAPEQEQEKQSRYQDRINQLTRARREAEERARMAEERASQMMEMQRFQQQQQQPRPQENDATMVGEMTREKWTEWNSEDPVAATRYVSRLEAKAVADEKAHEVMSGINRANSVQETINEVFKAHPELKDVMEGRKTPEEVPFWQIYDEVARELADAKYLVKGPLLVMKEAERRMKEQEFEMKAKSFGEEAVQREKSREKQVNSGHTAGSSPRPPSAGSVKLTPEEETIARKMRMTPEEYAKFK